MEEQAAPVSYGSVCAAIRRMTKDPPASHEGTKEVYRGISHNIEKQLIKTRSDQTLLAKVRSGHTTLFRAYAARINDEDEATSICPPCGESPHDFIHWSTQCAGTLAKRTELFGYEDASKLETLSKHPLEMLALAKSSLLGAWQ